MLREPSPLIIITTSRAPSPRTRSLTRDLLAVLPRSERVTRGHLTMEELAAIARSKGARRVVILGERRGNPSIIRIYQPSEPPERPVLVNIVTLLLRGVTLARERKALARYRPDILIVESDRESEDVADAMVQGFLARLASAPLAKYRGKRVVVARLKSGGEEVVADFQLPKGSPVGPRLRLVRPRSMVKSGGSQG